MGIAKFAFWLFVIFAAGPVILAAASVVIAILVTAAIIFVTVLTLYWVCLLVVKFFAWLYAVWASAKAGRENDLAASLGTKYPSN